MLESFSRKLENAAKTIAYGMSAFAISSCSGAAQETQIQPAADVNMHSPRMGAETKSPTSIDLPTEITPSSDAKATAQKVQACLNLHGGKELRAEKKNQRLGYKVEPLVAYLGEPGNGFRVMEFLECPSGQSAEQCYGTDNISANHLSKFGKKNERYGVETIRFLDHNREGADGKLEQALDFAANRDNPYGRTTDILCVPQSKTKNYGTPIIRDPRTYTRDGREFPTHDDYICNDQKITIVDEETMQRRYEAILQTITEECAAKRAY